ncbi:uncharacterized protein [Oryza sativa Japonica Group]|uniref:Os05g0324700 protein n=9 Tax=Oryza TaxID=4527 RepID=Q0DJ57_ORYSJ|nr:uncharacterized protein LOC4338424 [Oryza sativa Japonica Group]XP_052156868.1 uncharacterized protein LOC127774628 [Oryza glaberrima]KAB8098926.1 hypothetical protein EE612_028670 [Oryza sativa]AAV44184.1 unknown protein [Oryza sativa Japonica Group]KAF2930210.1 hypothetical protein DAI22_05g115900 [Oryza sativa Japonica Group]BAF17116.1 Os05g0324700 [Oryza sativa Japonica Group]BAG88776.1 unnamed protein product [Oryza sativa Japonica Group]|eukprot:NP_001055202.1 Os05g0324700 [Oryza sativa Japonica Group]
MASRSSSSRSRAVAMWLVALMVVFLVAGPQPASAARPLRPAGWNAPSIDGEGHYASGVVDKYAPLLLSMLPRGPVTPSGPSGGTNGDGN